MIEIRNLQKTIGQQTALQIPNLTVQDGEIYGVIGTVGSGIDILFDLLTGKTTPSLGTIQVAEVDPASQRELLGKQAGFLFNNDSLYERQSVRSNLTFFCRLYGLPNTCADEILDQVGLRDQANETVSNLPSGLKRRLAFGRSVLHQPKALILVEPFQRCDEASIDLLSLLIRQQSESGTAVMILADDSTNLVDLCDVVLKLERGQMIDSFHPKESQSEAMPFKIPVRMEGKVLLVNPAEILYADASDGKAVLYTLEGRMPTQFTLTELENRLLRSGFFRAHRSYLVNLQHIKEVIPYTRNSFSLRLNDPQETVIPLSKQAASELKVLLGY